MFGELAERIGQPAVLGEMVGGIVIGVSGFHLVDPRQPLLHLMAELGVILLLFLIGLETDIGRLLSVDGSAAAVAVAGVILPFAGGLCIGVATGLPTLVSIFLGAALTATSVGITARVLADLGHLGSNESQVILGAAVLDDILGLVLLTVVTGFAAGSRPTVPGVSKTILLAFGFVRWPYGSGPLWLHDCSLASHAFGWQRGSSSPRSCSRSFWRGSRISPEQA